MAHKSQLTLSVIGAGGKMGTRITNNLVKHDYNLLFCEASPTGIARIVERGYEVTETEQAVKASDVVILAVPDTLLGAISAEIVPMLKPGAILMTLDPAAAYAGQITLRDDCSFVVAHPCHPSVFAERYTKEEYDDLFGGVAAKQDIVIALHQGEEEKLAVAEQVAVDMYAPVETCHRITVEQMAILEPTAAEVVACTTAVILKEALNEAVKRGVPEEAAKAFMLGHIQIGLAVAFRGSNPFSDACQIAIDYGMEHVFRPDWKKIFTQQSLDEVLKKMLHLDQVNA